MSEKKLYIGNLSWGIDTEALASSFSDIGEVLDATVIKDRDTGKSRGFGFITIKEEDVAKFMALNGEDLDGRALRISEAVDKKRTRNNGDEKPTHGRRPQRIEQDTRAHEGASKFNR